MVLLFLSIYHLHKLPTTLIFVLIFCKPRKPSCPPHAKCKTTSINTLCCRPFALSVLKAPLLNSFPMSSFGIASLWFTTSIPSSLMVLRHPHKLSLHQVRKQGWKSTHGSSKPSSKSNSTQATQLLHRCKFCGGSNLRKKEECPEWGKTCTKCGGSNHFVIKCGDKLHK